MDKLRSIFCLLLLMISSASSAFKPIFGPPKVTLECSADYVTLNKVVGVSWLPTLLSNETSISTQAVNNRVQNCEAGIMCTGGYNKPPIGCTYNITTSLYLLKWEFSVPFHETFCSVQVSYLDHEDWNGNVHMTRESCSYSAPNSTILKQSSPVSATVGKPYWIQCSVNTSEKVNSRIVKINWSGPDGSITNDSRITVHPTVSDDGIVHNSTLEFLYLSQNDTGAFTCNMILLDTSISETFQLDKITIPTPNVSVTALNNQTLNNSLMLECNITTVRGITSNMDIVWMANNTIIRRMNNSVGKLINNLIMHRDVYHVSNVGSDGIQYHCHAIINESSVVKGSFFLTKPSASAPSPTTTSMSPTASMYTVSNSVIPTDTPNSSPANLSNVNVTTENPPSAAAKNSAFAGSAQVAIIVSVVIGFVIISLSVCVVVYKFRRELYLKNHYSTNNDDIHFKAPSISDVRYSITDKDDASTCENLDLNDKVVGWIKTVQSPDLNEQCDDSYPSNEEILNYVCGHNLRYCDSRQTNENVVYKELSKAEEGLLVPSSHLTMTNSESILRIGEKTMSDHDVSVFYNKENNLNIQTVTNNKIEENHVLSTVASQNKPYVILNANTKLVPDKICILHNTSCHCHRKYDYSEQHDHIIVEQVNHNLGQQGENLSEQKEAHRPMLHIWNNERTVSVDMANSDQLSLDSSSKLTEETLTSSVSSCSINISLAGGEYIENGSPSHSATINCIPIQSPTSFNNVKNFDGSKHLMTTAIEGEYVDRNIAVQQGKHTTIKN